MKEFNETLPVRQHFQIGASHGLFWLPVSGKCAGIVVCVHGLGLSAEGYEKFARCLQKADFATYAIDVRGCRSLDTVQPQWPKLDLDGTVSDLKSLIAELHILYSGSPIFVLGESVGGNIVMRLAALCTDHLRGVICSAPCWHMYKQRRTFITGLIELLISRQAVTKLAASVYMQSTGDRELQMRWQTDPLHHRLLYSAGEAFHFLDFIRLTALDALKMKRLPVLMIQGLNDGLVKPRGTARLFRWISSPRKHLMLLASAEHLIFEEVEPDRSIVDSLVDWMQASQVATEYAQMPDHRGTGIIVGDSNAALAAISIFRIAGIEAETVPSLL